MYLTLEDADDAVCKIASSLSMDVADGETVEQGIDTTLARKLCAIGAGYEEWRDLEMRVGTPDAVPRPTSRETIARLTPVLRETGVWDHPLAVEAMIHPLDSVVVDPEAWLHQTLELIHEVQTDVSRLEAAEAVFEYVRLASDPAIDDLTLTGLISLRLGMEVDMEHLRWLATDLAEYEGETGRSGTRQWLARLSPCGDDDWTRMALCRRASRLESMIHDMEAAALADLLTVVARFVATAGGAVSSPHMLTRLAVLRPARNTWRHEWRDQINPDAGLPDED